MVDNIIGDNYLEQEMEKILMDERDRLYIFNLEDKLLNFLDNSGILR